MPGDHPEEYYGPQTRSRGEIYSEDHDLDGTGDPALAGDRAHHRKSGKASGVDLADDRRVPGTGQDAPSSQVSASETDQRLGEVSRDFRTPPPEPQQGDPAPPVRIAVPDRWETQERLRRRDTGYHNLHARRDGDEAAAEPVRVSVGERLQLPPARFRTYGHIRPGLVSVGGRSAQSIDWSGADPYSGIPTSQIGPVGTPPPESKPGAQPSGSPPAHQVEYRDDIHMAAERVRAWLEGVFGPPEDVPKRHQPR